MHLLGVLPGWWVIRLFDDSVLLDACGDVPLGWASLEVCTRGDSPSGTDSPSALFGAKSAFWGVGPGGLLTSDSVLP